MTKSRGINKPRAFWTAEMDSRLREMYPDAPMADMVEQLGMTQQQIYSRASRGIGIKRSDTYLQSAASGRLLKGTSAGSGNRFKPGHVSANKGQKGGKPVGRSAETTFKPGQHPHNYAPVGSERLCGGYLQRKMTDTGYPPRDWKFVHVLLWEEHHGPVPPGHMVRFRDNNKERIEIDNLEMIDRVEHMSRVTIHRYPRELRDVIRLTARVHRAIEAASEKQD